MNIEELKKDNIKLNKIISSITNDSVILKEDLRLLSKQEIENFKEDNMCEIDGLVPLFDISNNDFIVYIINSDTFGIYNIVDELLYEKNYNIDEIINLL